MPLDFEPFYSASPPLFNHFGNTFSDFGYAGYRTSSGRTYASTRVKMPLTLPLRPCLIIRPNCVVADGAALDQDTPEDNDVTITTTTTTTTTTTNTTKTNNNYNKALTTGSSPTKNKKRVVFADDRGFALEHIKLMTEPSDCPPRWRDDFLDKVTGGACAGVDLDKWDPCFVQPASDYMAFRQKLERQFVSLENVIVRESDEAISGTVKVKNVSFNKEVFVRCSFDRWATHEDFHCTYVPSGSQGTSVCDLYDTFSFSFGIAPTAARYGVVEFCVCFRGEGSGEYWDNNDGINYRLKSTASSTTSVGGGLQGGGMEKTGSIIGPRFADAFTACIDTWTEFASWNHLINDTPYW